METHRIFGLNKILRYVLLSVFLSSLFFDVQSFTLLLLGALVLVKMEYVLFTTLLNFPWPSHMLKEHSCIYILTEYVSKNPLVFNSCFMYFSLLNV